jgi:hypothetical protein
MHILADALIRMYYWICKGICKAYRMFGMPKQTSLLLVMLLVSLIAPAPIVGQVTSAMPIAHERPAGCHQHGTSPAPQPVSYRCCQSGHDSAILQVSFISQPQLSDLTSHFELSEVLISSVTRQSLRDVTPSSADPPNTIPLRV